MAAKEMVIVVTVRYRWVVAAMTCLSISVMCDACLFYGVARVWRTAADFCSNRAAKVKK